jgi:hypothetical protein
VLVIGDAEGEVMLIADVARRHGLPPGLGEWQRGDKAPLTGLFVEPARLAIRAVRDGAIPPGLPDLLG